MFDSHSRFLRTAALTVTAALGVIVVFSGSAQVGQRGGAEQAASAGPVLNPRHPETYVVKRGDTLWDIAAMFLRDPWNWPEIWQVNPQVRNPHLIYPGDVLSLAYIGGRPVLQVQRGGAGTPSGAEKLSPRVRTEPLEQAIPTIPYETIRAFLTRPAVLDRKQLDSLPYVVANREGLMASAGDDVYARRADDAAVGRVFNVVHVGDPLVDPDDNAIIGYEGIYVGQGRVRRQGDPLTLRLTETKREATVGDLLVDEEDEVPLDFQPRKPGKDIEGRIMSVVDGVSLIGQYHVVVINRGARDGLEPGHVLRVFRTGDVIRDTVGGQGGSGEKVRLPDEPAGVTMVFRTFDRISYALVMEATDAIHVLDTVRTP
ncbi:MAG TPA: LysM domain-containing protein [Gammaproteobacteria bacterium]|nr:LysM domain-containing protein [Gammaproteobacteria bacterium]